MFVKQSVFASLTLGFVAFCGLPGAMAQEQAPPEPKPPVATRPDPAPPPQPPARPRRGGGGAGEARIPDSVQVVRDVVYANAPGDDGAAIELKMDTAFLKQSDGQPMPVVVYIHGGGWEGGSKEAGTRGIVSLALGGYFAVSIDYRLSGQAKYPAAVHDCKAAIRFIRGHAEQLVIDPNRIGVWGHSAGGHLAGLLGTTGNTSVLDGDVGDNDDQSAAVHCVVDISGPIDLTLGNGVGGPIAKWLGAAASEARDKAVQASPHTHIDPADPPVLIIHGTNDELVNIRHAELFEQTLKEAGVSAELLTVEGAGHGIAQPRVYVRVAEFFDERLKGHAAATMREFLGRGTRGEGRARPEDEPKPLVEPKKDGD